MNIGIDDEALPPQRRAADRSALLEWKSLSPSSGRI